MFKKKYNVKNFIKINTTKNTCSTDDRVNIIASDDYQRPSRQNIYIYPTHFTLRINKKILLETSQ